MADTPLSDAVARQYERWAYPAPIPDLTAWMVDNWQWFDPSHAHRLFWPDRPAPAGMEILVAGCGTNQAAVFALNNPGATVVGIDVSSTSLGHQAYLRDKHGLSNLQLHQLPIEEARTIGRTFDLVVSTGVLHHMADPVTGLRSLAGCLKPHGVAALMLYARYGRVGVEMLQSVFRDMGMGLDEPSLHLVRDALANLPADHPVASYRAIATDLDDDAGMMDTFMHVRERSYTVDECREFVAAAGLAFQGLFFRAPYHPPPAAPGTFFAQVASMPPERQWSVMERINFNNGCHFFLACRADRPRREYAIDFGAGDAPRFVPSMRHRCGLEGSQLMQPGWGIALDDAQAALVRQVDGRRTITEIADAAAASEARDAAGADARTRAAVDFFHLLWKLDFVAMGLERCAGRGG
jgi:SAM-dependent methyltransferase